jgi:hypothetical protein
MIRNRVARWTLPGLIILAVLAVCFTLTVRHVDRKLAARSYESVYNDCHKVWATRGLVLEGPAIRPNGKQNSIESVRRAFDHGARGTEVDVLFDTKMGRLIVSHDVPYNLKDGKLLTLEALFESTGGRGYFWIDFKKLRKLTDRELEASVLEMERLADRFDMKASIYVEGEAPFSLAAYRDAGFNTIFDTHPRPQSSPFSTAILELYKLVYYFGDFTVMAMNYGDADDPKYGSRAREVLRNIPVFIYHVDDLDVLEQLVDVPAVRVVMAGDHSVERYSLDACHSSSTR